MEAALTETQKVEFAQLVQKNMKRAYFTALMFLGSHDEAMDASQEAFLKAYKHFSSYDRNRNFYTWYYKILKNLCLNLIRDKKKLQPLDFIEYKEEDAEGDAEMQYEKTELREKVQEALFEMEPEDREIVVLREFEQLSYKEIAEKLEIPEGTVMSRLYYARKKIGAKLKEKYYD